MAPSTRDKSQTGNSQGPQPKSFPEKEGFQPVRIGTVAFPTRACCDEIAVMYTFNVK